MKTATPDTSPAATPEAAPAAMPETAPEAASAAMSSSQETKGSSRRSPARKVSVVVAIALLVFGIGSFIADRAIMGQTYARVPVSQPNLLAVFDDYAGQYQRDPVEFTFDGSALRGYVYGPENTRGLIVFRHGIFSQHQDYLPLILAMVDKGWRVFAYDAIGCGESDGDNVIGFSQSPLDVAAAVQYARDSGMADNMKIALWGHSWGGYGVAAALGLCPDVDACVTMSGFDTPLGIMRNGAEQMMGPFAATQVPTMWLNMVVDFGLDANRSASKAIAASGVKTLVIHGVEDGVVPYEGESILANASAGQGIPNVSTITFDTPGRSGHNTYFYSLESQEYLGECANMLQELLEENGDKPDASEVVEFLETVDKWKANTADPGLIGDIDSFLGVELDAR